MNTEAGLMRCSIAGRWTAREMAASFSNVNFLYDLRLYLNHLEDLERYLIPHFWYMRKGGYPFPALMPHGSLLFRPEDITQFSRVYFPDSALTVQRISYGSPGGKDYLGIGEILKQIKEFMQFMIMMREEKESRRLDNAKQRIENARNFVRLRIESVRADAEIDFIENSGLAALVEDNTKDLARLVESGKITDAIMLEKENTDEEGPIRAGQPWNAEEDRLLLILRKPMPCNRISMASHHNIHEASESCNEARSVHG